MRRTAFAGVVIALAGLGGAAGPAGAPAYAQEEEFGGLPEGPERPLVYGYCSGCHSVKLVMQQRMSRKKWKSTLDWMVAEQNMPEPPPETEARLLDYLSRHFGLAARDDGGDDSGDDGGPSPFNTVQPMQPAQ